MPAPPKQLTKYRRALKDDLAALCRRWADGTPWDELDDDAQDLLTDGHAEAARLGRLLGGDTADDPDGDEAIAEDVWDGEMRYWKKVLADIKRGRYGVPGDEANPADADKLARRIGGYTNRLVMTANETWVDTEPEETLYEWRLGPNHVHCPECQSYGGNQYRADDLPAIPGDGSTTCLHMCGCFLVSDDGSEGFVLED